MATNNGYSGTLVLRIGYTRSVCFRNRVRRSFGQSGAVLGVFLYLIFAVPGNGYLTTGYTRSWLFPKYYCAPRVKCTVGITRTSGNLYHSKYLSKTMFINEKTPKLDFSYSLYKYQASTYLNSPLTYVHTYY